MNDDSYTLYNNIPEIPFFMLDAKDKTMDVKDFGQATLNSNKFKHKQKRKKRK